MECTIQGTAGSWNVLKQERPPHYIEIIIYTWENENYIKLSRMLT